MSSDNSPLAGIQGPALSTVADHNAAREAVSVADSRWRWSAAPAAVQWLVLAALVAFGLFLVAALPWTVSAGTGHGGSLGLSYGAALALRDGHSPYGDAIAWVSTHSPTDSRNIYMDVYTYPLLLPVLLLPLSWLPLSVVLVLWELVSIASVLFIASVIAGILFPAITSRNRLIAIVLIADLVMFFGPVRHSMRDPQVDIEMAALAIGSWVALRRGHPGLSGVLLGLAMSVKPTFAFLIVYYLWRREWRAAATALVAGVAFVVVPFLFVPHAVTQDFLRLSAFWGTPGFLMAPKSISLFGVTARVIFQVPALWRIFSLPLVTRAATALFAAIVVVVASLLAPGSAANGRQRDAYLWSLAVLVMLLGSPLTEDAHTVLALVPLAVCAAPVIQALARGDRWAWWVALAACLFYVYCTLPVRGVVSFTTYAGWRIVLSGYWLYGLLGLAALFIWIGRRSPYRFDGPSAAQEYWRLASSPISR